MATTIVDKRKMSESMETSDVKQTIMNMPKVDVVIDNDLSDEDYEDEDEEEEDEVMHIEERRMSAEEMEAEIKSFHIIQDFLNNKNKTLMQALADKDKEIAAMRDVIKKDFQVDYKYIKKDY